MMIFKSQQDLRRPKIPLKIQEQSIQRGQIKQTWRVRTGSDTGFMKFEAVYKKSNLPLKYCLGI